MSQSCTSVLAKMYFCVGTIFNCDRCFHSFHTLRPRFRLTLVIRLLHQTFYRRVVFDRFLGTDCQTMTHGTVLEAAGASSLLFGGVHLFMHLLREGVRLSWYESLSKLRI